MDIDTIWESRAAVRIQTGGAKTRTPVFRIAGVVAKSTVKTATLGSVPRLMKAEVPLADEIGLEAGLFEQRGQHCLIDGNSVGNSVSNDAMLQAQLNRMAARHKG